jgi:hypothetical protein
MRLRNLCRQEDRVYRKRNIRLKRGGKSGLRIGFIDNIPLMVYHRAGIEAISWNISA